MPTYDYQCLDCNHTFEFFQPMSASQLTECPKCKGKLKRLIGKGSGPIFKGSGFYQTDYKNTPPKKDSISKTTEKKDEPKVQKSSESGDTTPKTKD